MRKTSISPSRTVPCIRFKEYVHKLSIVNNRVFHHHFMVELNDRIKKQMKASDLVNVCGYWKLLHISKASPMLSVVRGAEYLIKLLSILAIVFSLLAVLPFYQLWSRFKGLKIGDTLSNELVGESRKLIIIGMALLGIGCIFAIIVAVVRPY